MFCGKCGAPIPEGAESCPACGVEIKTNKAPAEEPAVEAPVEETACVEQIPVEETAEPVAEAPVEEAVTAETVEAPVEEAVEVPAEAFETTVEATVQAAPEAAPFIATEIAPEAVAPKKKKKFPKVLASIIAVVLCLGIVWWAAGEALVNAACKLFMNENEYYAWAEYKNIERLFDTYDKRMPDINNYSMDSTATVEITDEAKELLSDANIDIEDYLEGGKLSANIKLNSKDDRMLYNLALMLNDTEIIGGELIFDMLEQELYGKVPLISEDAFYVDMSEMMGVSGESAVAPDVTREVMTNLMSDNKVTNDVKNALKDYIKVLLKNAPEFDESTEKVEVEGVSARHTVLTADITAENMAAMLAKTLEELRDDDKTVKLFCETFAYEMVIKPISDEIGEEVDVDDVTEGFIEALDMAIDELNSVDDDTVLCTYTAWINNKGQIVGRQFETDDVVVRYLSAVSGGKQGTELVVEVDGDEVVRFAGVAKRSFDVLKKGNYTLEVNDEEIIIVELDKYDCGKAEKGNVDAKFRIKLADDAYDMIMDNIAPGLSSIIDEPAIEIEMKSTNNDSFLKLSALLGDKPLVSITFDSKLGKGSAVKIPEDSVDIEDFEYDIDPDDLLDELLERLEDAGLSSDVIDMITELSETETETPELYPDYDNDDYYYYYN